MTLEAVLYGPEGFLAEIGLAVEQRGSSLEMRMRLPIEADLLLRQVVSGRRVVCGESVSVCTADVMNRHQIFVSFGLSVDELEESLPDPEVLRKDILVGRGGLCAFRTHTGRRRHGSLSGLFNLSMMRELGEFPLLGDSVAFHDMTSSQLPVIRRLGGSTEVLLPSRCVTFGERVVRPRLDDAA